MQKKTVQGSLLILLFSAAALAADSSPAALPVWDFEQGIGNEWGGRYNVYQREPSWARTYLDPAVSRSKKGHSLRVTVHRGAGGFCGAWFDLAGGLGSPKRSHDAASYSYLSFRIKGQRGGEDSELSFADDMSGEDDEPQTVRRVSSYLPGGVTTEWQEALIPVADFQGVDLRRLARLTLHFTAPGDYRFYLDEFALKREKSSVPGPSTLAEKAAPRGSAPDRHRAIWVWKTLQLIDPERKDEIDRFFAFSSENHIREIYLAVEFDERETDGGPAYEIRVPERYRAFLERAHQQGFTVQGLVGTPEWAVRENHPEALAAVEAVVAFTRAAPAGARFDGVHFDVEPYSLLEYADPTYRPQVLEEFLEMVSRCVERIRTEPHLHFSCDVPAWFYPTEGLERRDLMVTFRGEEKSVGEHLTDMLDAVTIMDYINQADGAGGIIARGMPALQYASSQGKRILVGLETFLEADRTIHFVCQMPAQGFAKRLAATGLRGRLNFDGFRLVPLFDNTDFHIGLAAPLEMTDSGRAEFEGALLSLARKVNEGADPEHASGVASFDAARAVLARNPDWRGFETFEITDPENNHTLQGFRAIQRMSPRTTFHGLGREVFEEETRSSDEWLSRFPGFAGLAIHFYDSYRELMEGK
jgi:hypothetical protein